MDMSIQLAIFRECSYIMEGRWGGGKPLEGGGGGGLGHKKRRGVLRGGKTACPCTNTRYLGQPEVSDTRCCACADGCSGGTAFLHYAPAKPCRCIRNQVCQAAASAVPPARNLGCKALQAL